MNDPKQLSQKTPVRSSNTRPSPSKSPSVNGTGKSPSIRGGSARPPRGGATRVPQTSFLNTGQGGPDDPTDDDARAEHAALLEELRSRVQKAETASEEYQKQLNLLQSRLDESQHSHAQLEDQLHEKQEQVEELETEKIQATRQKRDLERIFDEERIAMLKDREDQTQKEEESQRTIARLKDGLAQKEKELAEERAASASKGNASGSEEGQFAPPLSLQRTDSSDLTKTVDQKERVIKSLRLELAEAQIKIMEIDSVGDGKVHELEKALMETKITNARLMEDNESFQLLLSEKTLNGDFSKTDAMQASTGLGSLAEELGTEDIESAEGKSDDYRKLESDVKSLKDQNKALALYIENIIGRLLSHKEFENILDKTPDLMSGKPAINRVDTDKELPPPPPEKDPDENSGSSFLQRARSVVAGPNKPRSRPPSQLVQPAPAPAPASTLAPGPTEDPTKAPSIPLGRSQSVNARGASHRRAQSEMPNAAPIVNQMYRGPPSIGSTVGGPMLSPSLSPVNSAPRTSFFSPPSPGPTAISSPNATPRPPSGSTFQSNQERRPGSSSNSTFSDRSGGAVDSPPRSSAGGGVSNNYTGAVMTQNRLRPLRLVQENPEMESKKQDEALAARKKANRNSWMPSWMGARNVSGGEGGQ